MTTNQPYRRELSIQISPTGFSFAITQQRTTLCSAEYPHADVHTILGSEPMLDPGNPGNNFHKIFIGCPTDHVLLLPRSLFDPHRAEQYLVAANMFSPEKTTLSNSILSPRAVAVWQTDAGITSHLLQLYPSALFYHPLLLDLDATPAHTINVILDSGLIHLVICHHSLHAAETLAASNPEELLYYISRLAPTPDLATYRLRIAGDGASILQPFFLRYFSQVDIHEEQQYNIQRITRLCE